MIDLSDTESLADFQRDTSRWLNQLQETGQPLVLTVDGKATLVVQDMASYQRLVEAAEHRETIEAVKQGLADVAAGRTRPMRETLEELGRKHKIPKTR